MIQVSDLIARGQRYVSSIGVRCEKEDWIDFINTGVNKLKRGRTLPWQKKETDKDFFTEIYRYPLPSDFESFIKPTTPLIQGVTDIASFWWKNLWNGGQQTNNLAYGKEVDFFRNFGIKFALTNDLGTPYLLARITGEKDLLLENFSESIIDDTDPYTLGGDASNAVGDSANFREGHASLRFDITDNSNAFSILRTKGDSDIIDISDYINLGRVFLLKYMPTVITSVAIDYGSDNANFYSIASVTEQFDGSAFKVGWNVLSWDMRDATQTGSPVNTQIKFYNISGDNTGVSDNNFRVDGLYFKLPTNYRLPYNTKNNYQDGDGNTKTKITATTDQIIWDDLYEDVLLYEVVKLAAGIKFQDNDLETRMRLEFQEGLQDFNRRYPSNEAPVSSIYYRKANQF